MKASFPIFVIVLLLVIPNGVLAAGKKTTNQAKQAKVKTKTTTKTIAKSKADLDCRDFSSWQEAQDVFEKNGGVKNDIYGLDGDNDGIACEDLKR